MDPTIVTWLLVVWGVITMGPLVAAQFSMLVSPHGARTKEWLIGAGEEWRDQTHFRFSRGAAWADWLIVVPLLAVGSVGALLGEAWGYALFGTAGAISLYINVILWFMEKEYVYPSRGPLKYFTYYWGFFVYWGAAALVYSALRVGGVDL
ncbi:MAG: hypothetical protein QNJ12_16230 [Ilumatobacter sp.]|uniref:hypothetical protein n=1 Tax=Ilumatobacter sp. TaxID=1967498 RepID=UPI00261CC23F|nr:hypothetical protein [Ilumatobacter sp.]MDJ0770347.1 hypothetical protein [Ilumatobacter sp.]